MAPIANQCLPHLRVKAVLTVGLPLGLADGAGVGKTCSGGPHDEMVEGLHKRFPLPPLVYNPILDGKVADRGALCGNASWTLRRDGRRGSLPNRQTHG